LQSFNKGLEKGGEEGFSFSKPQSPKYSELVLPSKKTKQKNPNKYF